jgi:LexA-binding, inner membrane-associated putative hydrolase
MLGSTHRLFGAASGAGLAVALGWPAWQAVASAALAAATAAGALSPDLDQRGPWRVADNVLPDEALGAGGPMRHRGLAHWWALPAAAAAVVWAAVPRFGNGPRARLWPGGHPTCGRFRLRRGLRR